MKLAVFEIFLRSVQLARITRLLNAGCVLRGFLRHLLTWACATLVVCVSGQVGRGVALAQTSTSSSKGSAADLGDIPPIGWPLGVPLTCQAMTSALSNQLQAAVSKLRAYCNEQNDKMRKAGYNTCSVNECLDSVVTRDNGYDHGKFDLRIYRSIYTGEPILTLTYSYPGDVASNGTFPICFDPESRSHELLSDEFALWDFKRFAEFCAQAPDTQKPQ